MPAHEGAMIAGKYRVIRTLGRGGMGFVVEARHVELEQRVAIKFLLPETLGNPEAVARFAREARAAVRIQSEHVARVFDVGTAEDGAPYLVMEYLDGSDLANFLQERGVLDVEQAIEFLLQACEAIAEAHVLGIVHRDLKPANLFVTRKPDGTLSVKVLDFGISKVNGAGSGRSAALTETSALVGSPIYMSPEQMQSARDVDARSDIWSLGVILYELVAGHSPFRGATLPELVVRVTTEPPAPLALSRPSLPAGFEQVVTRCLAKSREQRFGSVAELAVALAPFSPRARSSVERISGVMRAFTSGAATLAGPGFEELKEPRTPTDTSSPWVRSALSRRRHGWLIAGGVAIAGVTAFAVVGRFATQPVESAVASAPSLPARAALSVPTAKPLPVIETAASASAPALSASGVPPVASASKPVEKPPARTTTRAPQAARASSQPHLTPDRVFDDRK